MSLSYFGQAPPTRDKTAALQLLGRMVSPTCACALRDNPREHWNECTGPTWRVAALLQGQAPHASLWQAWLQGAKL